MSEKQEYIVAYINNLAVSLNKQYSGMLPPDKVQKAINMFKDSSKELPEIIEDIETLKQQVIEEYLARKKERQETFSYYDNMIKDNRESRTYEQIKEAYENVRKYLESNNLKLFISGGTVPYLLLNENSNRLHDDIDTVCLKQDIDKIRQVFKSTTYYDKEWDSLNFSKDEKDYGFELNVEGVPVGIYPFSYENGQVVQYSWDPYNKTCKIKTIPVQELSDYVTSYKGADGRNYDTMSLEYIKLTKENAGRPKDLADVDKINQIGVRPHVMNRLSLYTEVSNISEEIDNEEKVEQPSQRKEEIEQLQDLREKLNPVNNIQPDTKGKEQTIGKQKKLGTYPKQKLQNSGFVNGLLFTLLFGMASGAIVTMSYILSNIDKYTFMIK